MNPTASNFAHTALASMDARMSVPASENAQEGPLQTLQRGFCPVTRLACRLLVFVALVLAVCPGCSTRNSNPGPGRVRATDGRAIPVDVKNKALGDAQRLRRAAFARAGLDASRADAYRPTIEFLGMEYKSGGAPVARGVHGTNNIAPGQKTAYVVQLADDNFKWPEWVLSHEEGHTLVQGELRYPRGNHGYSFGPEKTPGHPEYIVTPDGKRLSMPYIINGRWPARAWQWVKRNANPVGWFDGTDNEVLCEVPHE